MTVKELCAEYDLKFQTVYKKIKNHCNKELDGHITKVKGKSLELDEFAVNFLLPIHVKVLQAIGECEGIARENDELTEKLHFIEAAAEQTEKQLSEALSEIDSLKADLSNRDNKITELTKQLETEQDTFRQTVTELESRVMELTEENKLLTEKYEAVPKIFRKNQ